MSVKRQHRPVCLKCALEPRAPQKREDRFGLARDGFLNRRVVRDRHFLLRLCLRKAIVELDGLPLCNLDKGLDSLLSKRHQFVGRESAAESLGPRETNAINFMTVSVEQVDTGNAEHARKFVLVTALFTAIPDDRDVR